MIYIISSYSAMIKRNVKIIIGVLLGAVIAVFAFNIIKIRQDILLVDCAREGINNGDYINGENSDLYLNAITNLKLGE